MKISTILMLLFICIFTIDNDNGNTKNITTNDLDSFYYQKCIMFLKQEEGLRLTKYKCTSKRWTIGYGHRILKEERQKYSRPITEEEANQILIADFDKAIEEVKSTMGKYDDKKIIYLYAILCFQTGKRGFEEFDEFIDAVRFANNNDNPDSKLGIYSSLKNSKMNQQVPNRVQRYINLLVENV
jgi:GH24 family phage-related lysozyme (muramidase)